MFTFNKRFESSSPLVSPVSPITWEDPILFDEFETRDIPARFLPGIFGQFAAELASATETPEALTVMTILGVISTAIAKHFVISPKEGWQEAINIYTLIALPPANNKSLVLKTCTKPLVEWEKSQAIQLEDIIKRQLSERKTMEKIIDGLRINAAKAKDSLEQQSLINEISIKEANFPEIAALPVLFINDATPESLTTIIHEQRGRLGFFPMKAEYLTPCLACTAKVLQMLISCSKALTAEKYAFVAKTAAPPLTLLLPLF